jgi:GTP-binding protein
MLSKRRVLVVSKMDLSIPEMKVEMRESLPADLPLVFISSVTQEGIQELKDILWVTLQEENKNLQRPELLNENIEIEE